MFKIGDHVRYRSEGVCVIKDIRTERFNSLGTSGEYYILAPIKDLNSILYVPMDNKQLTDRMQQLLSADQINELVDTLKDERLEWIVDSRARNFAFRDMLVACDRNSLIILVNTLAEHIERMDAQGKKHTAGDDNIFKRAKKILLDEFSHTSNISTDEELLLLLRGEYKCVQK